MRWGHEIDNDEVCACGHTRWHHMILRNLATDERLRCGRCGFTHYDEHGQTPCRCEGFRPGEPREETLS